MRTLEHKEGSDAYEDGLSLEHNPYKAFNEEKQYLDWKEGWEDAQAKDYREHYPEAE